MLNHIKGAGLKTRLLHIRDELWDRRLGLHTFDYSPAVGRPGDPDWRCHYVPYSYSGLFSALKHVGLNRHDTFVDLGSGLGRAVFAAASLDATSIGVEINPLLIEGAFRNLSSCKLNHEHISFKSMSAEEYSHDDTTVLYMFNPFGSGTMEAVISRLAASWRGNPRELRIVYVNPILDGVIEKAGAGWLQRYGYWQPRFGSKYAISFWHTT